MGAVGAGAAGAGVGLLGGMMVGGMMAHAMQPDVYVNNTYITENNTTINQEEQARADRQGLAGRRASQRRSRCAPAGRARGFIVCAPCPPASRCTSLTH